MTQTQLREKAREMFQENWLKKAVFTEQNWLTPDSRRIIFEIIDEIITLTLEEKIKEIEKLIIVPESTPHLSPYISGVNETIRKVVKILKQ